MSKLKNKNTKRGDTIVEVMFAFAIFSFIAVISIAMMNLGIASAERTLELTTARNELNAQAEALRFIHSSYVSELTLPTCDALGIDPRKDKCQQYTGLWTSIISNTVASRDSVELDKMTIEYPLSECNSVYDDDILYNNHAFIINTRQLLAQRNTIGTSVSYNNNDAFITAKRHDNPNNLFVAPTLNARVIYSLSTGNNGDGETNNSSNQMATLTKYTRVAKVEGIWVIPVRGPANVTGGSPQYYDFYIQTCWNRSNSPAPTSLDAVIRLYNPAGV